MGPLFDSEPPPGAKAWPRKQAAQVTRPQVGCSIMLPVPGTGFRGRCGPGFGPKPIANSPHKCPRLPGEKTRAIWDRFPDRSQSSDEAGEIINAARRKTMHPSNGVISDSKRLPFAHWYDICRWRAARATWRRPENAKTDGSAEGRLTLGK